MMNEKVTLPNGMEVEVIGQIGEQEKKPIEEMGKTVLPNGWEVRVIK